MLTSEPWSVSGWCVSPKIVEISRILKGRNRPAVTDFLYSETDRIRVLATRRLDCKRKQKNEPARKRGEVGG